MGIVIVSKNKKIRLGYFGFMNLRNKVAELAKEDIGEHYKKLRTPPFGEDERRNFFEEYDKKTCELDEKYNGEMNSILYFLHESDCEATIPVDVCEKIYEVIKDYDDDILYGYSGLPDCATFKDFKSLVKDCIVNECDMRWF